MGIIGSTIEFSQEKPDPNNFGRNIHYLCIGRVQYEYVSNGTTYLIVGTDEGTKHVLPGLIKQIFDA
jgi:hypothetical protein